MATSIDKYAKYRASHKEEIAAKYKKWWPSYYAKNKEKILSRVNSWVAKNKDRARVNHQRWNEENRDKLSKWDNRYKQQNTGKYLYRIAKGRAKRRSLEFSISLDDIQIPNECPLLMIPISIKSKSLDCRPSLDRIDSSKGYVKGNIRVVSLRANRLKNDATGDELMALALNLMSIEGHI